MWLYPLRFTKALARLSAVYIISGLFFLRIQAPLALVWHWLAASTSDCFASPLVNKYYTMLTDACARRVAALPRNFTSAAAVSPARNDLRRVRLLCQVCLREKHCMLSHLFCSFLARGPRACTTLPRPSPCPQVASWRGRYEAVEREANALRQPYQGLARLLNCDADEVAIVQSATAAWTQARRWPRPTPRHPCAALAECGCLVTATQMQARRCLSHMPSILCTALTGPLLRDCDPDEAKAGCLACIPRSSSELASLPRPAEYRLMRRMRDVMVSWA